MFNLGRNLAAAGIVGMPDVGDALTPRCTGLAPARPGSALLIDVLGALRRQSMAPRQLIIIGCSRIPLVSDTLEKPGPSVVKNLAENLNLLKATKLDVEASNQPLIKQCGALKAELPSLRGSD